jgi:hypothetical protein
MEEKTLLNLAQGVRGGVTEEVTFEHYVHDVCIQYLFLLGALLPVFIGSLFEESA